MLGQLPRSLEIGGTQYPIRSDYRVVLRIIEAMNDPELTNEEKLLVCLANIYPGYTRIPEEHLREAYEKASAFIENGARSDGKQRKVMDWAHDETLIFPAINAAAGFEVRAVDYLHWWTFLGYFQSIDRESLFGTVLTIRQKKRKKKKLEPWEQEFYAANRQLCDLTETRTAQSAQDALQEIYESLLKGGAENGG